MVYLSNELWFPPPDAATREGLLAVGGDLEPERLLLAYRSGIFPWYNEEEPILWWSPDPRMVLFPDKLKVSKSLRKVLRKEIFSVTYNQAFLEVIQNCAQIPRSGQEDTWITSEMISAYQRLHELGRAISVEVWQEDQLVGGLYGIDLPERKLFCGESMFSKVSDASKVGFYYLVQKLKEMDYTLIDCQVHTDHLESLGAEEISRTRFLTFL
ncbi:MAG: leucyl/phenylalanyl-tRNA--protein transferase [Bacteroidota bacterium]